MWPGQQPPGGEQNPQNQNPYQQPGYQQPNPYQQPSYQQPGYQQSGYQQSAYQQPNPHQQQGQPQWGAPSPMGAPQPRNGSGSGGGNRTKWTAIGAATVVVVAAGVTGALVLGGKKDDNAGGGHRASNGSSHTPSGSASGNPRGAETEKPTVPGWQVVVNPKYGIAFDVPPDWEKKPPSYADAFADEKTGKPIAYLANVAEYKSKWCTSDDDKDGRSQDTALATVGAKGAGGARNTDEVAVNTVGWWVYAAYTQPGKNFTLDKKARPYTTSAGIKGSIAWAQSTGTPKRGKCDSDGKALTFGFKNGAGDFVSWNFFGAEGVPGEVPRATVMKILSTVRLHDDPSTS